MRKQLKEVEREALHYARHFQEELGCGRERHAEFSYQKMVLSIHFDADASLSMYCFHDMGKGE